MRGVRSAPPHVGMLLDKLRGTKIQGRGWEAFCPAHDDKSRPSLSISVGDNGAAVLHCHKGCAPGDVLGAVGLTWADVSPPASDASAPGHMHPGAYRPGAPTRPRASASSSSASSAPPFSGYAAGYGGAQGANGAAADTSPRVAGDRGSNGQGSGKTADSDASDPRHWPVVAAWDYVDADGSPSYRVQRLEPAEQPAGGDRLKSFRLQHWDGRSWAWGLGDAPASLLGLPDVLRTAESGGTVLVVEGEKCVEAARVLGYVATCNHGGSNGWRPQLGALLAGADVVILPDNDDPGRKWAGMVAESVADAGGAVRVLTLPGVGPKGDVADWLADGLAAGLTAGELRGRLAFHVERARPWAPGDVIPLPPEPSRFRVLSDVELEELPPPEWLAEGLLQENTSAALYGPPASGKSFLAVDLAACVATGEPWLGKPTKRGGVLYVAAEGTTGLPQRLAAWKASRGFVGRSIGVHFVTDAPNLYGNADAAHVIRAAELVSTPAMPLRLVVIDTLARVMVGADENSAQDVGTVIAHVDAIRRATGATVLVVHHAQKEGDEMRGSGALLGACESVLFCKTDDADMGGSVGAKRTLATKKQKDAPELAPIPFTLEAQAATLRGQPVGSVVVRVLDAAALAAPAVVDFRQLPPNYVEALTTLRDAFGTDGATATEWLDASGIKKRSFYRVTKNLADAGLVLARSGEGAGRGKRYQLTTSGRDALASMARTATGRPNLSLVSPTPAPTKPAAPAPFPADPLLPI